MATTATATGYTTDSINRVSAVFDNRAQAEQAILELRRMGVSDAHLSALSRHEDHIAGTRDVVDDAPDTTGEKVSKGLLAGAGIGALFGLAAVAIPGVGPFITAGWLAETLGVTGGAAVAGAIVGGTSGALSAALVKAGYPEHEASYYGEAIERGGVLVVVDSAHGPLSGEQIRSVLYQFGGRSA